MLTVGVDLAAEAKGTAVAWVEWGADGAVVRRVEPKDCDDDLVIEAIRGAHRAGVDCPLGWPDEFVKFVMAHRDGHVVVPQEVAGLEWRRGLTLRVTDGAVREITGLTPLRVSADRIGHTAMRCAGLLARLAEEGRPVDRSGTGVVVEVYPAASLKRWGLPYQSYKGGEKREDLGRLVDAVQAGAPWMSLGAYENDCRTSDDAFDAVIAALTARAAALGQVSTPGTEQLEAAKTEGWIALPEVELADLV